MPQDLDLSLEAGIWASRLGFEPRGWDLGLEGGGTEKKGKEKEEEKEEKFLLCESIGHRPLQGRCPKRILALRWDLGLEIGIWT